MKETHDSIEEEKDKLSSEEKLVQNEFGIKDEKNEFFYVKNIESSTEDIVCLNVSDSDLADSEAEHDNESEDEFDKRYRCLYCKDSSSHSARFKELFINSYFIPSDLHMKPIQVPEEWHIAEEGQFDDADL